MVEGTLTNHSEVKLIFTEHTFIEYYLKRIPHFDVKQSTQLGAFNNFIGQYIRFYINRCGSIDSQMVNGTRTFVFILFNVVVVYSDKPFPLLVVQQDPDYFAMTTRYSNVQAILVVRI